MTRKDTSTVDDVSKLPYRLCVGIMVLNRDGLVWTGRRIAEGNTEYDGSPQLWQMPQGGLNVGEEPAEAAKTLRSRSRANSMRKPAFARWS